MATGTPKLGWPMVAISNRPGAGQRKHMQTKFPLALGAGLVSGLLFLAAATGAVASLMVLVLLTPLPIAIAGFSWGWMLSAVAAATAFGFLTLIGSLTAGLFHLLLFGLPATIAIYYLLLNRPYTTAAGRAEVEWYPIGRVLFGIALASGIVATAALLALGTTTADIQNHVNGVVERMTSVDVPWPGGQKPGAEDLENLTKLLTYSFSAAIAMSWMWVTLFNLWIGAKVARASGLLKRPWPNVSLVELPRWAGISLAAAFGLTLLDEYPGHIASGFATGLFIAFLLVGLAIIHNITWKNPIRPLLLFGLYVFLILFNPLSSLAIATIALIEPLIRMRNPYNGGPLGEDPPKDT